MLVALLPPSGRMALIQCSPSQISPPEWMVTRLSACDICFSPSFAQMGIGRQGRQAAILDGGANGEVIQVLKLVAGQTQQVVKQVIEVAADAGGANAGGLGIEVEHLTGHAGRPGQSTIPPGVGRAQSRWEVGEHPQAEGPVRGNLLLAADGLGHTTKVAALQKEQADVTWTIGRPLPEKRGTQRRAEPIVNDRLALQQ